MSGTENKMSESDVEDKLAKVAAIIIVGIVAKEKLKRNKS